MQKIKMREKKEEHRINRRITASSVRLVGDNVEQGVYDTKYALHLAEIGRAHV